MTRSICCLVAYCSVVAAVAAENDELKNLRPGTLLIHDFGGRSIVEFLGYSQSGWFRVKKQTSSGEREATHSPRNFTLAPPGYVYGQYLAEEDAPKELQNLKPGTKLLVNSEGETIGEFVEYSSFGKFKVRVLSATGSEQTPTLSAKHVIRLAKPDEPFGWRSPEKPAEPRLPPKPVRPPNVAGPPTPPRGPGQPVNPGGVPGAPSVVPGARPGAPTRFGPVFVNPHRQTLQGSWKVLAVVEGGNSRTEGLPIKVVISENEIEIDRAAPLPLKIDAGARPPTMDIGEDPAIYNLTGDTLTICKSNGARRPTELASKPGDLMELYVCERCVGLEFAQTVPGGSPLPETLSTVMRLVEILKAERYEDFVVGSLPPDQWANPPPDVVRKGVAELQVKGPRLLQLLQAIVPMQPLINADRTEAVYDVVHYHIPGAPADSSVVFRKRHGRWYLVDPRDPQPEKDAVVVGPTSPGVPAPVASAPAPVSVPTAPPTVPASAPDAPPAAEDPDLAQLIGSWQVLRFEENGRPKPDAVPYKIRFSPSVLMLGTLPMEQYRLNSAVSPKQLDFGTSRPDTTAIYELDGDTLKICMSTAPGKPRPTQFTTAAGDGRRNLLVCKRIKPVPVSEIGPFSQVEPMLTIRLGELARIVEIEGFAGFLEKCVPPQEQRRLTDAERDQAKKIPQQRITSMVETLRAIQRIDPKLNADRTIAVYDLSGVHIESDPTTNFQELKFTKVDGKWYALQR